MAELRRTLWWWLAREALLQVFSCCSCCQQNKHKGCDYYQFNTCHTTYSIIQSLMTILQLQRTRYIVQSFLFHKCVLQKKNKENLTGKRYSLLWMPNKNIWLKKICITRMLFMLILLTLFGVVLKSPYWNSSQAGASLGSLIGTIMHYLLSLLRYIKIYLIVSCSLTFFFWGWSM